MTTAERLLREAEAMAATGAAATHIVELIRSYLPAITSTESAAGLVHNDHPLRHFDRTCPACIQEGNDMAAATRASNEPSAPMPED